MNITDKSALRPCTSCGVCATICGKKAINLQLDDDGFYRPVVDVELCNNCELCTSVCYKFDDRICMTTAGVLKNKPLYSAWSEDDELVRQTTSGGIGDIIARQLYQDGYKVVGVRYNEKEIRAEHFIAESINDLLSFRGSKYIQSYTFDAFKDVVAKCRGEKYAVFGTPCQIYALSKIATKRNVRDNFFFVDLYCHGCPSLHAWTKYQNKIKRETSAKEFDNVSFRSKTKGWGAFCVEAKVAGKSIYKGDKANDEFYELYFSNQILNDACYECLLRSTLEYTDIRLGDFWGHKYIDNRRGVSAISLATPKGESLFCQIKGSIVSSICSYEDFLPYQSWNIKYKKNSKLRKVVLQSLKDNKEDIQDAIKKLRKYEGISVTAKRLVKTFLSLFPQGLTNKIKKIIYKIR